MYKCESGIKLLILLLAEILNNCFMFISVVVLHFVFSSVSLTSFCFIVSLTAVAYIAGSTLSVTTYILVIYCETIMSSACDADSLRSEHIIEALSYSLLNFVSLFIQFTINSANQRRFVGSRRLLIGAACASLHGDTFACFLTDYTPERVAELCSVALRCIVCP